MGNQHSGRKSLRNEALVAKVISQSWLTISQALNDNDIPFKERRMIALEIAKKSCPKDIKADVTMKKIDVNVSIVDAN